MRLHEQNHASRIRGCHAVDSASDAIDPYAGSVIQSAGAPILPPSCRLSDRGRLIVVHLGFASATALTSAMLPILIAVLQSMHRLGMTMLLGYVVSFGFVLPINAPQNMVCLATNTFNARQFARVGIVLTIVGYLLLLLFAATWWRWLGWV